MVASGDIYHQLGWDALVNRYLLTKNDPSNGAVESGIAMGDAYRKLYRYWFWMGIAGFTWMMVLVLKALIFDPAPPLVAPHKSDSKRYEAINSGLLGNLDATAILLECTSR